MRMSISAALAKAKPDWKSESPEDIQRMIDWVQKALREKSDYEESQDDWWDSDGPAVMCAITGYYQPLRERYPHLAKFLNPPKMSRGKHYRELSEKNRFINFALVDCKWIRALWKEHYGEVKRTTAPSAEEIAADWWSTDFTITEDDLHKAKKKSRNADDEILAHYKIRYLRT